MSKELRRLADLTPDRHNANTGTKRGLELLERSLERNGLGRSILVDKHGVIIAGNKTTERAADLAGDVELVVVKTTGHQLVVVQREDLDLADPKDPHARELAIADNRVAEVDLDWDPNVLLQTAQADTFLDGYFFADELAKKWGQADEDGTLETPASRARADRPDTSDRPETARTVEADAAAAAPHDPADEDQSAVTCPECGHCWEPA